MADGVRFADYYAAAPICSPSRAGLLTGCYPRRVGLETWVQRADSRIGIHPDELTLAELLKANGYATGCIGKWHLGFQPPFLPRQQGFDHYFGLLHNLDPVEVVYFEQAGGVPLLRNGKVVKRPADPAELTQAYTDEAIQFIEQHTHNHVLASSRDDWLPRNANRLKNAEAVDSSELSRHQFPDVSDALSRSHGLNSRDFGKPLFDRIVDELFGYVLGYLGSDSPVAVAYSDAYRWRVRFGSDG